MQVPLFKPYYDAREHDYVIKCLRSGWSGLGPMVAEFEEKFAKHLGVKYALMTNSCTAALELALLAHDIGPGHRVAIPTMTFVATAHAVRNVGAEVVLCDVDEQCLLISDLFTSKVIKAVIPVLYAGQPSYDLADDDMTIIHDCAHAVGSTFDARG